MQHDTDEGGMDPETMAALTESIAFLNNMGRSEHLDPVNFTMSLIGSLVANMVGNYNIPPMVVVSFIVDVMQMTEEKLREESVH